MAYEPGPWKMVLGESIEHPRETIRRGPPGVILSARGKSSWPKDARRMKLGNWP